MKVVRVLGVAGLVVVGVLLAVLAPASAFFRPDEVEDSQYKCVLTLWHVETFEGGSTSRADYLQRVAAELERRERNLFVWVRSIDVQTLNNLLAEGSRPDMFSFGHGLGGTLKPFLVPYYDDFGIKPSYNQGAYAHAYLAGGYALVGDSDLLKQAGVGEESLLSQSLDASLVIKGKTISALCYGKTPYINPNAALNISLDSSLSQYEAYESFIAKKSIMLLATSRDINRIINREALGKGRPLRYEYLKYTDLVQYIGVAATDPHRQEAVRLFLNKLYSDYGQSQIASIGLMSVCGARLYSVGQLADMEVVYSGDVEVPSLF